MDRINKRSLSLALAAVAVGCLVAIGVGLVPLEFLGLAIAIPSFCVGGFIGLVLEHVE